jgi:hypothetical protein
MNPGPTTTASCDYVLEFSDDGNQPDDPEPEVIVMPPVPHAAGEKACQDPFGSEKGS